MTDVPPHSGQLPEGRPSIVQSGTMLAGAFLGLAAVVATTAMCFVWLRAGLNIIGGVSDAPRHWKPEELRLQDISSAVPTWSVIVAFGWGVSLLTMCVSILNSRTTDASSKAIIFLIGLLGCGLACYIVRTGSSDSLVSPICMAFAIAIVAWTAMVGIPFIAWSAKAIPRLAARRNVHRPKDRRIHDRSQPVTESRDHNWWVR